MPVFASKQEIERMKLNTLLTVAALSVAAIGTSMAATSGFSAGHHPDHATASASLQLNAGKKWETDAPLRQGMGNIRQSMAASLDDIHENRLSQKGYAALAKKIESEVGAIVANCKLEPQADAQLHLIVAELLDGSKSMLSPSKQAQRQSGAVKVVGALEKYGTYFQDPEFKPLIH
jgi:hypothetical protein